MAAVGHAREDTAQVGRSKRERLHRRTPRHREVLNRPNDHAGVFTFDLAAIGRE
jgi:hypothetical protein